jgi:hypothetical protein
MELFLNEFQEITGEENSNTIELMDALPLYQQQAYSAPTDTPRIENITFRKRQVTVTVKPAAILDRRTGRMKFSFAGIREQLIEATFRKMLSEPGEHAQCFLSDTGQALPAIATTEFRLRKYLASMGHGYKLSEIREALDILANTRFITTITDGREKVDLEGEKSIIGLTRRTPRNDKTGERSTLLVTLHPLVAKSISERTYRQINWHRFVHDISRPGARWLYARIVHHFTGVSSGGGPMSQPYNIDLETILSSSGMRRYVAPDGSPQIKDNIRQVRLDLQELVSVKVLSPLRPFVENLRTVKIPGKSGPARLVGAVWDLYLSPQTADEIISCSARRTKMFSLAR